jgi:hypothetical protein
MNPYRAFDQAWFTKNQKALLFLLNNVLTRGLFRRILCIRKCDIGYTNPILHIGPNYYTVFSSVKNGDVLVTTDFRTHWKYSKRVYLAFRPMWWCLHFWDSMFADKYAPELSFGFDTLTVNPDPNPETTSVDGLLTMIVSPGTWAQLRDGAGNTADDSTASTFIMRIGAHSNTNEWNVLSRSVFLFDTSALPSSPVVSDATLSVMGNSKADAEGWAPNIDVYASNPASNTGLTATDYTSFGSTSLTGSPISYASFDVSGAVYTNFILNATGRAVVSDTGVTKLGLRNANYDVANTPPTWVAFGTTRMSAFYAEDSGTSRDPKLVITYVESTPLTQSFEDTMAAYKFFRF